MAEGESGEKTEEPTSQKIRKAREKGQVAKSQDAVSALIFLGTFFTLSVVFSQLAFQIRDLVTTSFNAIQSRDLTPTIANLIGKSLNTWFFMSLPIIGAAFILGFVGNYFQVGFLFTPEPLKPSFDKINPINGFKQLFSKKRLVELLKQVVKFGLVATIVYLAIKNALRDIILLERMELGQIVVFGGLLIKDIAIRVGVLFFIVAAADYFWQRHVFKKSLMMTKQEIKQEYKESEGDPELKGERKRLSFELLMHGSQQRVAKADAVVTNPEHIAVAIQYDAKVASAPILVAKGTRKNAEIIKSIAKKARVPILRNVPLAHALNELDIDEEVPEELYQAVAEVLKFVYELQGKKMV